MIINYKYIDLRHINKQYKHLPYGLTTLTGFKSCIRVPVLALHGFVDAQTACILLFSGILIQ